MDTQESADTGSRDLKRKLETATNLAVLVAALLVAAYFVGLFIARAKRPEPTPEAGPGIRLALPEAFDFAAHDRTLILAIQEDCSYCEASIPFYVEITDRLGGGCSELGVVAALPNPPASADAFLDKAGLQIPRLANTSLASLGITGTPTVLLVDREGTVLDVWVGELSEDGQEDILAAVDAAAVCGEPTGVTTLWE